MSLVESKQAFESAREEWPADKKTLEDIIADMTTSEKNLAEDRLTCESDAQAHEERIRVSVPSPYPDPFIEPTRWVQTGCRGEILALRTRRLLRPSRISSGVSTIFGFLIGTTGLRRRLHRPNSPLLRVVGASRGKRSIERLSISSRGMIVHTGPTELPKFYQV